MHIQKAKTSTKDPNILTPLDPRWEPFVISLFRHLCPRTAWDGDEEIPMSDCDGSFRIARNILTEQFPEMDVSENLNYFRANRWFCDCTVMHGCPVGLGVDPNTTTTS